MGFLSKILGGSGRTGASVLPKTSLATQERIRNILSIRQLDSMPAQAARAFQIASDPKAKADDFISVIEKDDVLSARIIRVANSVYFFRGTPANDIEKAVANIGLDEIRCLISSTMLRSLLQGRHSAREQVWSNSVAVGICCRALSRLTAISPGEAFLCGLLHDVGKLVMIRRAGALYDKVIRNVGTTGTDFVQAEEAVFDLNHVEVGKWLGEMWNFPPGAILAIAGHHEPWPADPEARGRNTSPAMLTKVGDVISHSLGMGHARHLRAFRLRCEQERAKAFLQIGLAPSDHEAFLKEFERQFEHESALYTVEEFHA